MPNECLCLLGVTGNGHVLQDRRALLCIDLASEKKHQQLEEEYEYMIYCMPSFEDVLMMLGIYCPCDWCCGREGKGGVSGAIVRSN